MTWEMLNNQGHHSLATALPGKNFDAATRITPPLTDSDSATVSSSATTVLLP